MAIRTQEELLSYLVRKVRLLERRLSRRGAGRSELSAGEGIDIAGNGSALTPYTVSVEPTVVQSLATVIGTATQTGITSSVLVTGMTLAVTVAQACKIRVYGHLTTYGTTTSDVFSCSFRRAGVIVQDFVKAANSSPGIAATGHTHDFVCELDLPAGSHTFTMTIQRAAGSGTIATQASALNPNRLSIDRIG